MVPPVKVALALIVLASSASAHLQLTAREGEEDCDGVKIRHLVFTDDHGQVTYAPPRGWQYSGGGDRFVLQPRQTANAEAVIRIVGLEQPQVFDEATTKHLRDAALASLPQGAIHAAIISEEKNPVMIEHKETYLVVLEYQAYGLAYSRSLMFLNRKGEQVQFQLTALRPNFPQLQKQFMASHFSWQNL